MNRTLINELLHCYVQSANCKLFSLSRTKEIPQLKKESMNPYPQYVGTNSSHTFHSVMTGRLLVYLTGETIESERVPSQDRCFSKFKQDVWNYFYMKNDYEGSCELCSDTDNQCEGSKVTCGICKR